jgi:hypothetical protein
VCVVQRIRTVSEKCDLRHVACCRKIVIYVTMYLCALSTILVVLPRVHSRLAYESTERCHWAAGFQHNGSVDFALVLVSFCKACN